MNVSNNKPPLFRLRPRWAAALVLLLPVACASSKPVETAPPIRTGNSLSGNYLAGRFAQSQRDMDTAVEYLSKALEKSPTTPDLLRRSFVLLAVEGRMREASALAKRVVGVNANAPIARLALVSADIRGGDYEAADRKLVGLPQGGINAYMVPLLRSWTQLAMGKSVDEALKTLEPLGKKNGSKALHDLHAALILEHGKQFDEAEEKYLSAAKEQGGASLRLSKLLGNLYERTGKAEKAKALYLKFKKESPRSRFLDPDLERIEAGDTPEPLLTTPVEGAAEGLFGVASSLRQQNAREIALIFGRMALDLRPDFPEMQILIADILDEDGRLEAANTVYASVAPESSFSWAARMRIASNLNKMDQTADAIKQLNMIAKDYPERPDPLIRLGDILRGHERFKESITAYDNAEKRITALEPRHWSLLYARGISLEQTKQWSRAEGDFLKALEFRPDQPYVLNYLGYSWVDQGLNLDKARKMIRRAVSLRPNDGYIIDSLGWVHYRLGEYKDAVRELERAAELRPEDPVINDHLGDAYWRVGRQTEARYQWVRALGLEPKPALAAIIKDKIKNGLKAKNKSGIDG